MSTLPSPRALLSSLLPPLPPPNPSTSQIPPSRPLHPAQKPLFLTLHCLFPNDLIPALDLLDRNLVTRLTLQDPPASSPPPIRPPFPSQNQNQEEQNKISPLSIYSIRSSRTRFASKHARFSSTTNTSSEGIHYEVRLKAWNCTCAAFVFATFAGEWERGSFGGVEGGAGIDADGSGDIGGGDGGEGHGGREGERRQIGGVTFGEDVPVCKHLLACLLAERVEGLGAFVEERCVGREEMAGWAAGWGG
ncbi:MAG: hypothetical protein HETSPECPRED_009690 [Heterodermia speciosa]|uniref:SWIM-type domain-containing protein n=1 Tax=Heterodermia speciosa TaxID=116794 RepID=A0A8H3G913_9LECA|nr:MAG: hypothetical protein HETSPECPRED_009690 [Heterodermia speciosa]